MTLLRELEWLELQREQLLAEQFDLALQFYAIGGDTNETRVEHRAITQ